ncbi:hypothetical protein [Dyadobacter sp. CY323]|uniref:hypothetical protein n=1 Tax=Dyadobacter sp. CY323 TaxID=2907302 RepID=UPI001F374A0B|nr:hypothetical protein [Dyadobacter sp. CY323]MCE6990617.1 hypothetical protein [Dyadobacter sp. CY323]
MKTVTIFLTLIFPFLVNGQSIYSRDKIISGNTTFLVTKPSEIEQRFVVRNINNRLFKRRVVMPQAIKGEYLKFVHTDDTEKVKVKGIITAAIGDRMEKLGNEKLRIQYYIDKHGVIKEINFVLSRDTKILPNDLKLIEQYLKEKYIFKVDSLKLAGVDFIPFFWPVHF